MQLGVFIPIGNNGWLISTTSPQYKPTYDLNLTIVRKAEAFGFDFALSMIKLHGFGGPSQFWDYNLESFTLMAGLAAATSRIQLFATCAVLTVPPAFAARMATTIDSISHGRFGVNIISGWQRREYTQMGIWPGAEHYKRRYDYCAEYVTIMKELWRTGRSDFKGDFFQMDDCRCLPMPTADIPIICAAQSDAGTKYAATHADYNFCASFGYNAPKAVEPSVARLVKANEAAGRDCGALILTMIIADETDDAANAKWEHYKAGTDVEALAYRDAQAEDDPSTDVYAQPNRRRILGTNKLPTNQGVLVGSYATVAKMLDELSTVPGVRGVMMTFDDFVIGMEQFGTRIMPLMRCRDLLEASRMSGERSLAGTSFGLNLWPRGTWPRLRLSPAAVSWLQVGPLALVLLTLVALPAFLFLVVSFWDYDRIGIYPAFMLDNYKDLLTTPATWRVYVSSLRLSFIVWAVTLFLGFNIAWFLVHHVRNAMVRTVLFLLCAVPFWTSGIIRTIAWIPFLGRNGAFNQMLMGLGITSHPLEFLLFSDFAVIITYVHLFTLLMVGPIANSMAKIDPALIEAARDAGASRWRVMTDVVIPLSKTGIALGSILVFTQVMGDYFVVRQMSGGQSASIVSMLSTEIQAMQQPPAAANAVVLVVFVAVMVAGMMRIVDVRKELVK